MDTLRLFPANLLKWSKVQPSWTWTSEHYIWLRHHFSVSLNSFLPLMWFFFKIWHIKNLLRVHIQGWVQVLFSIPGRQQCEWVQLTEIPWHSDGLITSQIPLLTSLHLCPIHLMHYLIRTSGPWMYYWCTISLVCSLDALRCILSTTIKYLACTGWD